MYHKPAFAFLILLLFCIPLFFLNIQSTHPYGDDWAQYLKEGLNIAEGKPYNQSGYIYNSLNKEYAPPQYPPGYPLLLAPVVKWTGLAVKPLLYLNAVFLCIMLFAGFYYFRKKFSQTIALCLSIILVYTDVIMDLKGQVLSDIPCALCILLYLALRTDGSARNYKKRGLLILLATLAILIRTQAVLILFSEAFLACWAFFYQWKRYRTYEIPFPELSVIIGVLLLYSGLSGIIFPVRHSAGSFYMNLYSCLPGSGQLWGMIGRNVNYLYDLIEEILYHKMNDPFLQVFVSIISASSLILAIVGLIKSKRDFSFIFFAGMCLLIVVMPVRQGLRYFLPAIPVFLYLAAKGLKTILPAISSVRPCYIAVFFTFIFLALGYDSYEHKAHDNKEWVLTGSDSTAFNFVKNHVGPDEIVLYSKPRLLTLFTDKKSMNLSWNCSLAENKKQFEELKVSYLLYCSHLNLDIINQFLRSAPRPYSDSVIINDSYILYVLKSMPTD